jgi:peroxiredoxin
MASHYLSVARATAPEVRGAQFDPGSTGVLAGARRCSVACAIALLAALTCATSSTSHAAELRAETREKPAFTLADVTETEFKLATRHGRAVVVHFFATWCEPCREELPALRRLAERAGVQDIDVVAISVAEVPIRVRRFIEQTPVNYPVLLDEDRAVAKAWGVDTLPTTFVLDAGLKTRFAVEREYDWDGLDVATLLEKLSKE